MWQWLELGVLLLLLVLVVMLLQQWRRQQHHTGQRQQQIHQQLLQDMQHQLTQTREAMIREITQTAAQLQHKQDLLGAELTQRIVTTLAEQGRADQQAIQQAFTHSSELLSRAMAELAERTDQRLEQISGTVSQRLDHGFQKTNETFASVMARLATIDEAQKKIDGLTSNVVSLNQLLGDKRSRGAFGEVQLEALIQNMLPVGSYAFQQSLSNGTRVDCLLHLPAPTGNVAVDAKFPLENYQRMFDAQLSAVEQQQARRQFKADIKKHVDAISGKYLIQNETSDGAIMFVPAEAIFAELHAYHADVIDYAMRRRVWLVSPTTLMAILNTARAVLKDGQMREQVHIIQLELVRLSRDFQRFDQRMKRLADNIRRAHEEAGQVEISSRKISEHFARIEAVEVVEEKL